MPTEWATAKAKELLPFNSHRESIAVALDAARSRGAAEERERWQRRVEAFAEREERYRQDAARRMDDLDAASYDRAARVLRSLLSAPAEVAGREEGE